MSKQRIKLFCIAFLVTTGSLNLLNSVILSSTAIAIPDSNLTQRKEILIVKKSGGRSGGGSFKRRPSRSSTPKRSTPSRSKNQRRPSPSYKKKPSRSKNQRRTSPSYQRESDRTYRQSPYEREPSRTYRQSNPAPVYQNRQNPPTNYRRRSSSGGGWLAFIIFLLVLFTVLIIVCIVIFQLYKMFSRAFSNKGAGRIAKERDNDRVTVSLLQVALSSAATGIQQDLSALSTNTDTETESGLVTLMQESALILLRHEIAWTHVLSDSNSLDIERAESAFDRLSIFQRSKFSSETLSNIDGTLKTRETKQTAEDDFADYVVVTLILGTADDQPLFTKINTQEGLKEALLQISSMRDDYLFKFELLWTPQQADRYLTDEELLLEYTDMIPLT